MRLCLLWEMGSAFWLWSTGEASHSSEWKRINKTLKGSITSLSRINNVIIYKRNSKCFVILRSCLVRWLMGAPFSPGSAVLFLVSGSDLGGHFGGWCGGTRGSFFSTESESMSLADQEDNIGATVGRKQLDVRDWVSANWVSLGPSIASGTW